jgi:hypothetical protein
MMKIVAMVGDAHTNIRSPYAALPIGLRWFSDGLYVVWAAQEYQRKRMAGFASQPQESWPACSKQSGGSTV